MKGAPICSTCSGRVADTRAFTATAPSATSTSSRRSTPSLSLSPTPSPSSASLTEDPPATPTAPSSSGTPPPSSTPQSPSHPTYPLLLIFDFDSTLTQSCTLPTLLSLPTRVYQSHNPPVYTYLPTTCPHTHRRPLRPPTAADLSAAYHADLQHHESTYIHPAPSVHTDTIFHSSLSQELAYHTSLRPVERASFLRGKHAFAAAGVTPTHLEAAASAALENGTVRFREGWKRVLEKIQRTNTDGQNIAMGIISVSWSRQWIRNLVSQSTHSHGLVDEKEDSLPNNPKKIDIRANDIFSPSSEAGIYISADKAREMADMLRRHQPTLLHTPNTNLQTIYVGDSLTDLEPLLAASIGIIIRPSTLGSEQRQLSETLTHLGSTCSWLGQAPQNREPPTQKAQLWWAHDLVEIVQSGILDNGAGSRYETKGEI